MSGLLNQPLSLHNPPDHAKMIGTTFKKAVGTGDNNEVVSTGPRPKSRYIRAGTLLDSTRNNKIYTRFPKRSKEEVGPPADFPPFGNAPGRKPEPYMPSPVQLIAPVPPSTMDKDIEVKNLEVVPPPTEKPSTKKDESNVVSTTAPATETKEAIRGAVEKSVANEEGLTWKTFVAPASFVILMGLVLLSNGSKKNDGTRRR